MARYDWLDDGQPWLDDWEVITPSTALAVSVDEVKQIAKLPCDCDAQIDHEIEGLIRSSQAWLESRFGKTIMLSTLKFTFRGWPLRSPDYTGANLFIPRPPTRSVVSVEYYDVANALQVLSVNDYRGTFRKSFHKKSDIQIISDDLEWPELGSRFDRVFLTVTAGQDTAAGDVLDWRITRWIGLHAAHSYLNGRDVVVDRMPHDMKWSLRDLEALMGDGVAVGIAS